MSIPADLKYIITHEWARRETDGSVTIGITHHAQEALGDLVFVELPAIGSSIQTGQECGVVESVKAASDIYTPISGQVIAINQAVIDNPELVNHDAYANWLFRVTPNSAADYDSLLDAAAYQAVVDADAH